MSKLRFNVVYCKGEEPDYPAIELNNHSPTTKGWQSPQFCEYPQEIGFALAAYCHITQVQILSHQSKIATKIELFVGEGNSYQDANFRRLGYLSLNSNERSNYQARELKSVYVDTQANFVKLLVHKCFINQYNLFNQVGIIAVNLLGDPGPPGGGGGSGGGGGGAPSPHHPAAAAAGPGPRPRPLGSSGGSVGSLSMASQGAYGGGGGGGRGGSRGGGGGGGGGVGGGGGRDPLAADLAFDMNYDPETAARLREIVALKQRAVAQEDYDAAKAWKAQEVALKRLGGQLAQLDQAKRQAVAQEDYDRAKALKQEIEALRQQVAGGGLASPFQAPAAAAAAPGPLAAHPSPGGPRGGPGSTGGGYGGYQDTPGPAAGAALHGSGSYEPGGSGVLRSSRGAVTRNVFNEDSPAVAGSGAESYGPPTGDGGPGGFPGGASSARRPPVANSPEPAALGPSPGGQLARTGGHAAAAAARGGMGPGGVGGGGGAPREQEPAGLGAGGGGGGGPHPLAGVPNHAELPAPEPVAPGRQDEAAPLQRLLGDYRVACLLSKNWGLREAAIVKVAMMVPGELGDAAGDFATEVFPALCRVARLGAEDKIAQVFLSTLRFLDVCLEVFDAKGMKKIGNELEPLITTLVTKLGDGQARIRDASLRSLLALARARSVGAQPVVAHALRKMPKKQASAWRPLVCRLQLVGELVRAVGCAPPGPSPDQALGFVQTHNGFAHSSGEVRDAARDLAVAVAAAAGAAAVERHLGALRPKQLEEYREAFRAAAAAAGEEEGEGEGGGGGGGGPAAAAAARQAGPGAGGGRGGRSPRSARGGAAGDDARQGGGEGDEGEGEEEEEGDFLEESGDPHTCQFCGARDPDFDEEALDLHYWQDCVMLMSCRECSQVIEIACLAEHYLTECEFKDKYIECDVSGEVVLKDELKEWQASSECRPAADDGGRPRCLLCHRGVGPPEGEEGWRRHLTRDCSQNPRLKKK